jgi:hypothetical protein
MVRSTHYYLSISRLKGATTAPMLLYIVNALDARRGERKPVMLCPLADVISFAIRDYDPTHNSNNVGTGRRIYIYCHPYHRGPIIHG